MTHPSAHKRKFRKRSNIADAGAQALAQHLPHSLQGLWLSDNNISDAGAQALAQHLTPNLQEIYLNGNNLSDAGFQALLEAVPKTVLKHLSISVPSHSFFYEKFKNLRNRQGSLITVIF
ncbi:MAG: leucine-rich repeat domain-containing protein [Alphaproteobacteria bacterium]